MKLIFLVSVLALSVCLSFGQRIRGVYVGRIFSDRNALVLEVDGSQVTGSVYLNKQTRLSFEGTYNKPELRGILRLASGKNSSLQGSLAGTALTLTITDSSETKICILHKISTKWEIDMADLFSMQYDMLLLGVWVPVKIIDVNGNDHAVGKMTIEYGVHGGGTYRLTGIPPQVNTSDYSPGAIAAAQSARVELTWETHDGQLEVTEKYPRDYSIHRSSVYFFKNDTLVTRSTKGYSVFQIRSR